VTARRDPPVTACRRSDGRARLLTRLARDLAVQDVLLAVYLVLLLCAVLTATGPGRERSIHTVVVDAAFFTVGIVLTRGGILRPASFTSELAYRLTLFLPVFLSYFQLRWILPAVSPHSLDAELFAFDLRVFGFEPALAWSRFATPAAVEWFAFFYLGYFVLLAVYVLPMMLNGKDELRLAHFALGMFIVFCTGHLLYMVVPGSGPYLHLADRFAHPIAGGLFWRSVQATVAAGGSQKDIFPSLHTAGPTYFALYSFMHRRVPPFRFAWPFAAFVATQIVVATMLLRWHYVIDVVAGIALAAAAVLSSRRVVEWEQARRAARGAQPIFTPLDWSIALGAWTEPADTSKSRYLR
jgi:hypothetical protein